MDLQAIARELVVGEYLDRTHIGLDFFDASINRVAAWSIGTRNILRDHLVRSRLPQPEPEKHRVRHAETEALAPKANQT